MADRTVKVSLIAEVTGYISGMDKAAAATTKSSQAAEQQLAKQRDAMQKVGAAALAMGTVAAAGVAFAVKTFADFDAKMSQVQALSHATAGEMDQLRDAALSMGQGIGFSASQVADAETELVKAGISVKDILGGALQGALTLAAAGQIDVADATEIATIAMTQFALKGKDIPHVADLLSAGADKALGGVADLGEALKSGGLVAAQFGVSLDETVGTLSAFANAGLIGETAGTDLRQMLLKLGAPAADAQKTMKDLGISIYDSSGQFVGMANLAGQLKDKMKDLDPATRNAALATIFGSRAIAGANVLYKEGAKGISEWTSEVNDQGFAAEQAAAKMNNLEGDTKKLGAAFEADLIKSGSGANDVLRGLVQGLTDVVSTIGGLPQPVLTAGLAVGGLVAAVGLLGGGFLTVVPKIAATKLALATLRTDLPKTSAALAATGKAAGLIGVGVTAATVGFDLLDGWFSKIQVSSSSMANSVKTGASAIELMKSASKGMDTKWWTDVKTDAGSVKDALESAAHSSTNFFDAMSQTASQKAILDTFGQIGKGLASLATTDLPTAQAEFANLTKHYNLNATAQWRLINQMPEYKDALTNVATGQGIVANKSNLLALAQGNATKGSDKASKAADSNAKALSALSGTADDTTGSIDDLADAISNFGKGALDVDAASSQFQQSIDDMTDSIEKNGQTLDLNTQQGRDNDAALRDIATSTLGLVSAQTTAGESTDTLKASMQTGRDAFIAAATAAGLTSAEAETLANKYGLIPKSVDTAVGATGIPEVSAMVQGWINKLNEIPGSVLTTIGVSVTGLPNAFVQGPAEGGTIYKAGGGRVPRYSRSLVDMFKPIGTDTVPAMLTPGEEVINARQAQKHRPLLKAINAGTMGFAYGGSVPPTYVPAPQQYATAATSSVAPQFNVVVQSRGGVDLLKYVDVSIERADARQGRMVSMGRQRGGLA